MRHLVKMLAQADATDRKAGSQAYQSYRAVMTDVADYYDLPLERVTAAFVALSPNSDYHGNLRSLVSVIQGIKAGRASHEITVSTYGHCRDRAHAYLTGQEQFWLHAKGPKTRAFYHNILHPEDPKFVTVDAHIYCCWAGQDLTVKEVRMNATLYRVIEADVKLLAQALGAVPCALQATLWFTRKRVTRTLYNAQLNFFQDPWNVAVDVRDIVPYTMKELA